MRCRGRRGLAVERRDRRIDADVRLATGVPGMEVRRLVIVPAVVLGAAAARSLGIDRVTPTTQVFVGVALAVGAIAGVYPAARAARLPPTDALRAT
jgi:putative ABC transport system permease protein